MELSKKNVVNPDVLKPTHIQRRLTFRRNLPLFVMLAIPLLFFVIFSYIPMGGLIMAFQNYRLADGILGSEWVGMRNFRMIFRTKNMYGIILNTLRLGLLNVIISFPFPIILAIMLNDVTQKHFKKFSQTILYLPHFFSWIVLGGMVITFFSNRGPINQLVAMLGGKKIPFLTNTTSWTAIYIGSGIWKEMGYDAIIYLAALTAIDPTLYEAAKVDGASKWQQIIHITFPGILPTIILMLILATGRITSVGFDKVYILSNPAVSSVSNVVSVFTYEFGIRSGNFSIATAMGLFDSVLSLVLVMTTNFLARRTDQALF